MKTDGFTFERINAENVAQLPRLYRKVLGKRLTAEQILKKYNTQYTGTDAVGIVVFDANRRVVGFYGYVPTRFHYNGKVEIGMQSCDMMIVKELRGEKLFARLNEIVMPLVYETGVSLFFGFGSQVSGPVLVNQGWTAKEELRRFIIPTGAVPFGRVFIKLELQKFWQRYVRRKVKRYVAPYEGEFHVAGSEQVRVVYDKAYFEYKIYQPVHFIRIGTVPLLIKTDTFLHVGAISVNTDAEMENVIATLRKLGRAVGLPELLFQVRIGSPEEQFLSKKYTGAKTWPVIYKNVASQFPVDTIRLNYFDFDAF